MCNKGIDIFDPNCPFFNDICYPFESEYNTDIPLKERRKEMFQNVSLCDTGCTYKGYDCKTNIVKCECKIKEIITIEETEVSVPFFKELLDSTNIAIIKCYKLLFDINNYPGNIGFFLLASLIIFSLACMIVYYCSSKDILYAKIGNESKDNPPQHNEKNSTTFELDIPSSDRSKNVSNKNLLFDSTFHSNINDSFEPEEKEDIDDLPYTKALRVDHRNLIKMNWDIALSKIELIQIVFFSGAFDLITLNLSVYILSFGLDFTLNALLFSDDVISKTHKNQGKSDYTVTFMLSLLSNLIGNVLSSAFIRLTAFNFAYEEISQEIKNKEDFLSNCTKIIRVINRKIVLYYILEIILLLFFIYYDTIFCILYHCSQMNWFIDCITGVVLSLIYSVGISIMIAMLRYCSLHCRYRALYNVSRYINK